MTRPQFDRYVDAALGTNPFVVHCQGGVLWSRPAEWPENHLTWCPHSDRPVYRRVNPHTKADLQGRTYGFEAVVVFDGALYKSALDELGLEVLLD